MHQRHHLRQSWPLATPPHPALPPHRELDVSSNQLAVLPDSIVRMPALQQLVVDHNALEYLPDNIGSCTSLVRLVANTNQLTALPSSLALLPRLQRLDASANLLTTVPPALGGIKTLKEFNLRWGAPLVCAACVPLQQQLLQCWHPPGHSLVEPGSRKQSQAWVASSQGLAHGCDH